MKKSLKVLFLCLCFLCSLSFIFSFDMGGSVEAGVTAAEPAVFPTKEIAPSISGTAVLWGRTFIGDRVLMLAEGNYKLDYTVNGKANHSVDLSLLKFSMNFDPSYQTSIKLSMGRFNTSDRSGLIYGLPIDGVSCSCTLPEISFDGVVGYTGLTNINSYTGVKSPNTTGVYALAPGYLMAKLGLSAPNLFHSFSLGLDFAGFIPINDATEYQIFSQLLFNGAIISGLYYNGTVVVGLYKDKDFAAGVMASAGLSYYPEFLNSAITASVQFATDTYKSFSQIPASLDGLKPFNGMLKFGLNTSIKPFSALLLSLGADYIMDIQKTAISQNCVEWNAGLRYQILSDVLFNMSLGQKFGLGTEADYYYFGTASLKLFY